MTMIASSSLPHAGRENVRANAARKWGALAGGGALAIYGLTKRSGTGLALAATGGALAYIGAKSDMQPKVVHATVLLNCSPERAFEFWRKYENLPLFMRHLESVSDLGNRRSRWIAIGPMNRRISWDAEITREIPNQSIAWHSLPGSEISIDGLIEFRPAPANRGTLIDATAVFRQPAGRFGNMITKLFGKDPSFMIEQDLRRLKALIETGEIPTIEGQPHGPRTLTIAAARVLDPDRPVRGEAKIVEVLQAKRRAS